MLYSGKFLMLGTLALSVLLTAASTRAADPLANIRYLVGNWSCVSKSAEGAENSKASFRTTFAPNVLAYAFEAPDYSATGYLGYDSKTHRYFDVYSDLFGGTARETAVATSGAQLTFAGMGQYDAKPFAVRETITHIGAKMEDRSEMQTRKTWTLQADSTCSRSPAKM